MADLTLTITIPDGKVARSKARSLANRPNDIMENGEKKYSDKEWIEFQVKEFLMRCDEKGKRKLAATDDTDMFEA